MLKAICSLPDNCFETKPNGDRLFKFNIHRSSQGYRNKIILDSFLGSGSATLDLDQCPYLWVIRARENKHIGDKFNYTKQWGITIKEGEFERLKSEA